MSLYGDPSIPIFKWPQIITAVLSEKQASVRIVTSFEVNILYSETATNTLEVYKNT